MEGMAARKETSILDKVLWFDRRIVADIDYFDLLLPKREVSHDRRFHSGLYRSLKCNRGIQYESALELRFAELLEQDERVRFYWEQPVKIPYWRGRRKVNYTPDFGIYLTTGHVVLAEVKELADMLDYRVEQKTEALMAFCAERGFGMLLTDGRHTPADLLKGRSTAGSNGRCSMPCPSIRCVPPHAASCWNGATPRPRSSTRP